jgi:hypothetical protein
MIRGVVRVFLAAAAVLALTPAAAFAQEGQIAGSVRDTSDAVMPGVTVEVTSPALIEKVRVGTTDGNGQYRITNLPVGTYKVTFSLAGFTKQERDNIVLTSGFTAPVNGILSVGQLSETVIVAAETPVVDVQNAREAFTLQGDQIKQLPTSRNVNSLLALTPGIQSNYRPTTAFGAPGVCVGGIGVFCNPGVNGFNVGDMGQVNGVGGATTTDQTNLAQGRVLVDGQVINAGASVPIVGQTGGYTADVANAAEVNIRVSGALGESETGGSEINIVPKTGGNRYSGDFNSTYTTEKFFATNNQAYPTLPATFQPVKSDHDISGAFGGPIKRDRLWFYAIGRDQGIHKLPVGVDFWPNLWEGKWGYNYQPDRNQDRVEYTNIWRNVSARITYQASAKNKFNIFWDEQDFCQDPCTGVVSVFTSPESWFSPQTKPNRLRQLSWTNPISNRMLLEAGLSFTNQMYRTDMHRQYTNPIDIPRISETGDTVGADSVSPRVNVFAGGPGFALTSGSLNSNINGGGAEVRDYGFYRTRAAVSIVTGGHHTKLGYDGGYYKQLQTNKVNNVLESYNYIWPAATLDCATGACGNTSLQFPSDPLNFARRPIPNTVDYNTGSATLNDHVFYAALYAQDQWTLRRVTASFAVRYDHASSGYGATTFAQNQFVPVAFTVPASDGVNYNDITPRFGLAWDVRGTGKTSVKWNMGRYNNAAGISDIYANANPARRTVNLLRRNWNDVNGNRHVDCDLMNFTPNGECGTFVAAPLITPPTNDTVRFGRDPLGLDAAGTPIGLATTQCGRTEQGIPASVQAYCNQYGESLLNGWGRRRGEWQFGLGLQHEILPRLSAEVTYNRRNYVNITVSDQLGIGCDRYNGSLDVTACQQGNLNYVNPSYDFYTVTAPSDPRLPNGGGYSILGLNTPKTTIPVGVPTVQTFMDELQYSYNGVDTQFNWRGPKGIQAQGGTSTGRVNRDTCFARLDAPDVRGREGAEALAGCKTITPFQTVVRGSVTYTVPKVDVQVGIVFQSLPGVEQTASMTYSKDQVIWTPPSASRATEPCAVAANGVGCLDATRNTTTVVVPLLLNNEFYGQRVSLTDLKLAKNIRFSGKRISLGVDIYNLFNSDAITSYNATFTPDNPATPANENTWLQPMGLVSPRFMRLQIQVNF